MSRFVTTFPLPMSNRLAPSVRADRWTAPAGLVERAVRLHQDRSSLLEAVATTPRDTLQDRMRQADRQVRRRWLVQVAAWMVFAAAMTGAVALATGPSRPGGAPVVAILVLLGVMGVVTARIVTS